MPSVKQKSVHPTQKILIISTGLVCLYLALSHVVHHFVFPEPPIPSSLAPHKGTHIVNPVAGEEIRIIRDRFETNGSLVEIEVTLAPGGAVPLAHIHQYTREIFIGIEGTTLLTVNGVEHQLRPGTTFEVDPAVAHVPSNPSEEAVRFRVIMSPPRDLDVCLVQVHQFLSQEHIHSSWVTKTLQLMRYAHTYDIYLAGPPLLLQRIGLWLLTPTLRMLGYERFEHETETNGVRTQ